MTTTLPPDPYKILGVSKDAQVPEIRSAHRKLVLKCHPDKVQDPKLKALKQDEFQKVQQAYELLSDDAERQKYDDQVRLAELRRQMQTKANISTPRSGTKYTEYEIRTPEPRPSAFRTSTSTSTRDTPPITKSYTTYSRSWEDDIGQGPRIFEASPRSRSVRREEKHSESRSSKREAEREREREREKERERELKDKERRKKEKAAERAERAEEARRLEKEQKEQRRAEKKAREKQRDKEMKREAEDKRRHNKAYVEDYDEDDMPMPRSEKKKSSSSSSKKYDEKRDRSSHRSGDFSAQPAMRSFPEHATSAYFDVPRTSAATITEKGYGSAYEYIQNAQKPKRAASYHSGPPAVPTPPQQGSPFAAPEAVDDDARRSSARSRRGSGESGKMHREKSYRKSSREQLDDHEVLIGSPSSRSAAAGYQYGRSPVSGVPLSSSPPKLSRTSTMPVPGYTRSPAPAAPLSRAQTFSYAESLDARGRHRSRNTPQQHIDEEDSDDAYDSRHSRRHRSGRSNRSSEDVYAESVSRQPYDAGRTTYTRTYQIDPYASSYGGPRIIEARPSLRQTSSYSTGASAHYSKVKESPAFNYNDVQYSAYA